SDQVYYQHVEYHYGKDKKNFCTVEKRALLNTAKIQRKCPFTRMPLSVSTVTALTIDRKKQQEVAKFFDSYKKSAYYEQLKKEQYETIPATAPAAIDSALEHNPQPTGIFNQFQMVSTRTSLNPWEDAAFRYLVAYKNFSKQQAFDEVIELSFPQAGALQDGLTREDVIRLNFWHIEALKKLKAKG